MPLRERAVPSDKWDMHTRLIPLALAALSLGGCSLGRYNPDILIPVKRVAMVREAAENYGANLRWGRLDAAVGMVEPDARTLFLVSFRDADPPVRFTSFEIIAIQPGESRVEVEVLASFRLYRLPDITERIVRERQIWRFQRGGWYIRPDLALFLGS